MMATRGASIADLLKEHRLAIDDVLGKISTYLTEKNDPELHKSASELPLDEFIVLKYLLSSLRKKDKAVQIAYENLVETLSFRQKYRASMDAARAQPELDAIVEMSVGGYLGDELVVVSHWGAVDFNEIKKKYDTADAVFAKVVIQSEQLRLTLDKRSRETGRLCKCLSVVDLEGISFAKSTNMTVVRALGQLSKANEINYPQYVSRIAILKPPAAFRLILNVARPFLSKNTMEKFVICGVRRETANDCSQCPFIKKFENGVAQIPKDAGGTKECTKFRES